MAAVEGQKRSVHEASLVCSLDCCEHSPMYLNACSVWQHYTPHGTREYRSYSSFTQDILMLENGSRSFPYDPNMDKVS